MAGRASKLSADTHQRIVAYIRAGAFDWVAAEAAGIGRATFYRWLERGETEAQGPYREFFDDVRQARAQARVTAELEVRRAHPVTWLRYGPGRDRPGAPGWTDQRQLTGADGGPVELRSVDDDVLLEIARRIVADG